MTRGWLSLCSHQYNVQWGTFLSLQIKRKLPLTNPKGKHWCVESDRIGFDLFPWDCKSFKKGEGFVSFCVLSIFLMMKMPMDYIGMHKNLVFSPFLFHSLVKFLFFVFQYTMDKITLSIWSLMTSDGSNSNILIRLLSIAEKDC